MSRQQIRYATSTVVVEADFPHRLRGIFGSCCEGLLHSFDFDFLTGSLFSIYCYYDPDGFFLSLSYAPILLFPKAGIDTINESLLPAKAYHPYMVQRQRVMGVVALIVITGATGAVFFT